MQAVFYNFSKRTNSTATPSGDGWTTDVKLKGNTSLINPTLYLSTGDFSYNYFRMKGRYYWVTNVTSVTNDTWEVTGTVDVLGTYKNDINNTSAFVSYSASDYDTNLTDVRAMMKNTTTRLAAQSVNEMFSMEGCYLLGVYGGTGKTPSMITTYVLFPSLMKQLTSVFTAGDALDQIAQYFADPVSLVAFCKWLPIDLPKITNTSQVVDVWFGNYNTGVKGYYLNTQFSVLTIPFSTNLVLKKDFRAYPPYTYAELYLPSVGVVPVDMRAFFNYEYLYVDAMFNYVGGTVEYILSYGDDKDSGTEIFHGAVYSGALGIDVPLTSRTGAFGAVLNGLMNLTGSYLNYQEQGTSNMAIATGVINGLGGLAKGLLGADIRTSGTFSGSASFWYDNKFRLYVYTRDSVQEPSVYRPIIGNCCMKTRRISGLSGYCQTRGFSVGGDMTLEERAEINQYMDGGVYLE